MEVERPIYVDRVFDKVVEVEVIREVEEVVYEDVIKEVKVE